MDLNVAVVAVVVSRLVKCEHVGFTTGEEEEEEEEEEKQAFYFMPSFSRKFPRSRHSLPL